MILLSTHKLHPGDAFKRQEEEWRRAYAEAHPLRERFPAIEQLVAQMAFVDPKAMGRYSAQMRTFSPSAKAFFAIPCPRTLCLDGGFDFDAVVAEMITARKTAVAGTLECAGCIGPSPHAARASCLLRLTYEIRIAYRDTVLSAADRPERA